MAGSGAFTNLRSDINFFGQIPLKVECKRVENLSVNAWLKQAKDQAEDGEDWMLIFRRSHEKSVAMLDANLAVEALGSLYSQKGPGIRN